MQNKQEILKAFGEKVKELRKEKGMTQTELAHRVGYKGMEAISKIERGVMDISQPRVAAIAKALDVPPSVFFLIDYEEQISIKDSEDYIAIIEIMNTMDPDTLKRIRKLVEVFRKEEEA